MSGDGGIRHSATEPHIHNPLFDYYYHEIDLASQSVEVIGMDTTAK
jgi:hypothetical protein